MKKFIILLFLLLTHANFELMAQPVWIVQPTGVTDFLWNAHFVDVNTGYAVGSNARILKTTNSGSVWFPQASTASVSFIGVDFINAQTGWIAGHSGRILRTTDGGTIWSIQYNNPNIGDCFFVNAKSFNAVWINTGAGVLFSSDGGTNWNFQNGLVSWSLNFLNVNYGWLGELGGNQYRTTNSGVTWQLTQNINNYYAVWLNFVNPNLGWSVGYDSRIYKSTNGGVNWQPQVSGVPTQQQLRCVQFPDSIGINGWVVGFGNTFIRTTNGGINWISQTHPINTDYTYIQFVNSNTGWAVGGNGTILKTTNGGNFVGIEPINNSVPANYKLAQNYPNPFNPSTTISFAIPKSGFTKLIIYNVLGKEVEKLVSQELKTGAYEVDWNASNFQSGIYFYKLETNNFTETRKMILLK